MRYQGSVLEWQTRHLVRAVVSTVPVPKGKRNPLIGLIEEVRFIPDSPSPAHPSEPESWTPDDEPEALRRAREGPPGTAEKFLGMFGR
jgi:hypothetical protein